jgi:MFS family permease
MKVRHPEMKRVTIKEIFYLNAYWIGLSFMWNSLHVIILPAVLLHLVPDTQKNTYLGLLTFVGLIIAMLIQPISGSLSDRWVSRWGRRRPLIFLGTAFDFLFLAFLGWSGGLGWLALGYIGLQFSSNIAHGPAQGLLPDKVPPEQLGQASGFKNLMDMAGLVVSSLLIGRLLTPEVRHPVGVTGLVAAVLAAGAALTLLGTHEAPAHRGKPGSPRPSLLDSLRVDWHVHHTYGWLIASRFFYLAGIYGIQTFAQYYVRDVLDVPNPIKLTGDLLAAITLALIAFALAGGWLGDRFGHKRMSLVASLIGALGCLLLLWARTPTTLLIFGSVLGAGIGLFLTSNWALANELAPAAEAGKFLGLTNLATAGAGAVGRLEGPLIDVFNNLHPGAWIGYIGLFLVGAISILASAWLLRRISIRELPAQSTGEQTALG